MKNIIGFVLVVLSFVLAACDQFSKENVSTSISDNSSSINTAAPACAKRDENRRYINGKGCTPAEWKIFHESQN